MLYELNKVQKIEKEAEVVSYVFDLDSINWENWPGKPKFLRKLVKIITSISINNFRVSVWINFFYPLIALGPTRPAVTHKSTFVAR